MTAKEAKQKLKSLASPDVAKSSGRFFKTGPGQYGEGDIFIGIKVPTLRTVSREFRGLPLNEIESLLKSAIHEERHLALMILVLQVAKCDDAHRRAVFDFYMRNTKFINNWDLVDCSAPQVVGGYLMEKSRKPLLDLTKSKFLWERRIAIVSTQHFIRHDDFADTLAISQRLLKDEEDLIHKATGWMLREVGQKAQAVLEAFLDQHASSMPRTMLRYAIEKFPPDQRRAYLQRKRTSIEGGDVAFDDNLAARIRDALARRRNVEEKKMFGCLCFLLNGNALAGVWKNSLIARLGPDEGELALLEPHVRAFDITRRPMRNWVAVEPEGVEDDGQLKNWIERAIKFVKTLPKK